MFFINDDFGEPTRVGYLHGFPPITYKFYKLSVGKKLNLSKSNIIYISAIKNY